MSALTLALLVQAGPHFAKSDDVRPFEKGRRLVAAYTYAWYDADTDAHLVDPDGTDALQDHPPAVKDFSGRKPVWHRAQLDAMQKAGIDLALHHFAGDVEPVKALAAALAELDGEKREAPRIGLLLDASSKDLAAAARDFFSLLPPRHWALCDDRPVVWLTAVESPRPLDALRETFEKGAGRAPFVVAELSWKDTKADLRYAWGAARTGPRDLDVVSVGPGFNDLAVHGRTSPTVREREGGRFYEKSWYVALRLRPRIVAIETWNNFHEATEVCESKEHGRAYLDLTAKCADKQHRGEGLMPPKGPWTGMPNVNWQLKYAPYERGIRPVPNDDGLFEKVELAGIEMVTSKANKLGTVRRLYFDVDDSWLYWEKRSVQILVEYLDQGQGAFTIEYDSSDAKLELPARAHKSAGEVALTGTGEWREARVTVPDAYFAGRMAGGADLRISIDKRGLAVKRVVVRGK